MDLKYKIQNSKLIGDNKIIVDNLLLGERVDSPDATNLPLDLAIALLKDSNGRIDIGLPVSGDLSNPQFRLGPLIWKALVNLLTKAVTSPFRALGALFPGATEKFEAVAFDPGSAELLPPEKEKLKKLADALQKRPELKLVVQGRYSTEADGITFKELSVRRAVAFRLGSEASPGEDAEPLDFSDSKTRRALEEIYQERFGAPALDEIEQALEQGTIKPRATPKQADQGERKKPGLFSRVAKSIKIYKIVPGAKSPEESELMAGELYARLVEKEPVSEKTLSQLAQERAQAVIAELQSAGGVPEQRLDVQAPETVPAGAEPSASLSLDALAEAP
jgi:outer membrane protein OmpA-like peptidoglycan-associated protein